MKCHHFLLAISRIAIILFSVQVAGVSIKKIEENELKNIATDHSISLKEVTIPYEGLEAEVSPQHLDSEHNDDDVNEARFKHGEDSNRDAKKIDNTNSNTKLSAKREDYSNVNDNNIQHEDINTHNDDESNHTLLLDHDRATAAGKTAAQINTVALDQESNFKIKDKIEKPKKDTNGPWNVTDEKVDKFVDQLKNVTYEEIMYGSGKVWWPDTVTPWEMPKGPKPWN